MPRNKTGGKGGRKGKNRPKENKELIYAENNELYGQVTSVLGNGRFKTMGSDGIERISILRGTMRKKMWVNRLDTVLIEPWEFEKTKASILHKYSPEENNKLKKQNLINFKSEEEFLNNEDFDPFAISDSDDENIESLDENSTTSKFSKSDSSDEEINFNDI